MKLEMTEEVEVRGDCGGMWGYTMHKGVSLLPRVCHVISVFALYGVQTINYMQHQVSTFSDISFARSVSTIPRICTLLQRQWQSHEVIHRVLL